MRHISTVSLGPVATAWYTGRRDHGQLQPLLSFNASAGGPHLKQHMRREPSASVMMRECAVNFPEENSSYGPTVSRFFLSRP